MRQRKSAKIALRSPRRFQAAMPFQSAGGNIFLLREKLKALRTSPGPRIRSPKRAVGLPPGLLYVPALPPPCGRQTGRFLVLCPLFFAFRQPGSIPAWFCAIPPHRLPSPGAGSSSGCGPIKKDALETARRAVIQSVFCGRISRVPPSPDCGPRPCASRAAATAAPFLPSAAQS